MAPRCAVVIDFQPVCLSRLLRTQILARRNLVFLFTEEEEKRPETRGKGERGKRRLLWGRTMEASAGLGSFSGSSFLSTSLPPTPPPHSRLPDAHLHKLVHLFLVQREGLGRKTIPFPLLPHLIPGSHPPPTPDTTGAWLGNGNDSNFSTCKYKTEAERTLSQRPGAGLQTDTAAIHEFVVCVTSSPACRLARMAPCLTPASYPIRHRPPLPPGSGGIQGGLPAPPALAGLRQRDTRDGAPGAARQAASPWDNFQPRHARHGKVQSSEPKTRDSSPLCSLPASRMPPLLGCHRKPLQPTAPTPQPQETPLLSPPLHRPAGPLGLRSPRLLPRPHPRSPTPVPSRGHAGWGTAAALAPPGQWSRAQGSPARVAACSRLPMLMVLGNPP